MALASPFSALVSRSPTSFGVCFLQVAYTSATEMVLEISVRMRACSLRVREKARAWLTAVGSFCCRPATMLWMICGPTLDTRVEISPGSSCWRPTFSKRLLKTCGRTRLLMCFSLAKVSQHILSASNRTGCDQ